MKEAQTENRMTEAEAREIDLKIGKSLEGKLCSDCPPEGIAASTRCWGCPRATAMREAYDNY